MKDKNYEGLANRHLLTGKVVPIAAAVIFSVLLPGQAFAESGDVKNPGEREITLENPVPENLVLDSQRLNLDASSAAPGEELVVDETEEVTGLAPTKLALAEQAVRNRPGMTGVANDQSADDAGSAEPTGGESPQKHYALILALVALISLVPMSRRHP